MTMCYLTLGSNDLEKSYAFYDPVMEALGATFAFEYEEMTFAYKFEDGFFVWITKPQNGEDAHAGNGRAAGFFHGGDKPCGGHWHHADVIKQTLVFADRVAWIAILCDHPFKGRRARGEFIPTARIGAVFCADFGDAFPGFGHGRTM